MSKQFLRYILEEENSSGPIWEWRPRQVLRAFHGSSVRHAPYRLHERKRVSIAETTLSGSPLQCWDNSTRGLDSATALDFSVAVDSGYWLDLHAGSIVRLRSTSLATALDFSVAVDSGYWLDLHAGSIVRLRSDFSVAVDSGYWLDLHAGSIGSQSAYDLFDKGILRGPSNFLWTNGERKGVFGPPPAVSSAPHRQTTGDFLTSLTNPAERGSPARRMNSPVSGEKVQNIKPARGWQRLQGDLTTFYTTVFGNFAMSLIISSLFYNLKDSTSSFYSRGALLFYSMLFL
ncbi:hypothetical protein B0H14DRAFT_3538457 [Mycena olivaceomarginata]|nr:hypothetical protein B0H14DRAFT_3538457 [Mycena olivaceomarginata]